MRAMRYLLALAALALFTPFALAQGEVVSYDPKVLAGSFIARATLVGVVTQMLKVNVVDKLVKGGVTRPSRYITLTLSLLVAEGLAFALQFVLGGITDPQFAAIEQPAIKAAAYGAVAWLSVSGFVAAARSSILWIPAAILAYKTHRDMRTKAQTVVDIKL